MAETFSTQLTCPLLLPQSEISLNNAINRLENFLHLMGFLRKTLESSILTWLVFLITCLVLPLVLIHLSPCNNTFEIEVLFFNSLIAFISLITLSTCLTKHGMKDLMLFDRLQSQTSHVQEEYAKTINEFFWMIGLWLLPFLLLEAAREVIYLLVNSSSFWWRDVATMVGFLVSWVYSNVIYLSGCVFFSLICNLQVIDYENYEKFLEKEMEEAVYIQEHMRMTDDLSKISHRFRGFVIAEFISVTASQFVALVRTTGGRRPINLISGGSFAVSSLVEVVGLLICLHAAAKITHRAQRVASVATKWHSLATCTAGRRSDSPAEVEEGGCVADDQLASDLESWRNHHLWFGYRSRTHQHNLLRRAFAGALCASMRLLRSYPCTPSPKEHYLFQHQTN